MKNTGIVCRCYQHFCVDSDFLVSDLSWKLKIILFW